MLFFENETSGLPSPVGLARRSRRNYFLSAGGNGFPLSKKLSFATKRPMERSFLAGIMVRVTSSPGLNELRAQPCLAISCGLLVSTIQCVGSPLSFLPSIFRKQCGLAQSHSVTVPDTLTFLSVSYAAFPWCANSEVEIMNKPIATTKNIGVLGLRLKSSVPMSFKRRSAVTCHCDSFGVRSRQLVTRANGSLGL